ncbi:MAG: hypothetical protein AAFO91_19680, partial [Bacteroidota bacterium]
KKQTRSIDNDANPKWKEVNEEVLAGQMSCDRQDFLARVFRLKLACLMKLITKTNMLDNVNCHMYTVEWQKRGLPHAHILMWLSTKIRTTE